MSSLRQFSRDQKGATAVEFAMVASMFVFTILFILLVGFTLFINQALDNATQKAARQVMTGGVLTMSKTDFQLKVCSYLPTTFNCSNVIVNLYTVVTGTSPSGYYNFVNPNVTTLALPALANGSASYQPGIQGSFEYMIVIYPVTFLPSVFNAILGTATYNGAPAYLAIATAAFKNEQY